MPDRPAFPDSMSPVSLLVYVHILLMVFWIGTDIGVYVAGLRFIDPKRNLAERSAVISLGMVIDRLPRICFVAMVPVGLQLSCSLGLLPLSSPLMRLIWVLSAVWMAVVIAIMVSFGKPQVRRLQLLERSFHIAGLVGFTAAAIGGWTGRVAMPGWVAGKLLAYGAMFLFAILLERSFAPVFGAFGTIAAEGSTPGRESVLRGSMMRTYVWVLAIYAAVLVSGFLGTVKP